MRAKILYLSLLCVGMVSTPTVAAENTRVLSATSNLVVEGIEPQLEFWVDDLGFEILSDEMHNNRLGFVMLQSEGAVIMLQTVDSLGEDLPQIEGRIGPSLIYLRVSDVFGIEKRVSNRVRLFDMRTTDYGATEFGVQDPAGNYIIFAQFDSAVSGE